MRGHDPRRGGMGTHGRPGADSFSGSAARWSLECCGTLQGVRKVRDSALQAHRRKDKLDVERISSFAQGRSFERNRCLWLERNGKSCRGKLGGTGYSGTNFSEMHTLNVILFAGQKRAFLASGRTPRLHKPKITDTPALRPERTPELPRTNGANRWLTRPLRDPHFLPLTSFSWQVSDPLPGFCAILRPGDHSRSRASTV